MNRQNPAFQRAMILSAQGRHVDAERELRGVLAQDPHDALAHAMLSLTLVEAKKPQEASEEAEAAVGLAPDLPLAHYAQARALLDRHYLASAANAIHEAIRLDSREADHFALLAAIRLEQRRWADALAAADQGLQEEPEHAWCINLRSIALVQLGRRDEAGAAIGDALRRDPENAQTHANQGWAKLHEGDANAALIHFRESLRLEPDSEWARAGIVEAMKARYFLYRVMLRYFLWMSRLNQRAQWGIMVGGYVGYQVLRNVARTTPAAAPFVWPILIAYIAFVYMTWLSVPLFNMLLRLNRFGRYALSQNQTTTSNLIALLLFGAVSLAAWGFFGHNEHALVAGLACLLLTMPTSSIFNCHAGWPRWTMVGVTIGLAVAGFSSIALEIVAIKVNSLPLADGSLQLFHVFLYGILIASFGANYLASVRPKT